MGRRRRWCSSFLMYTTGIGRELEHGERERSQWIFNSANKNHKRALENSFGVAAKTWCDFSCLKLPQIVTSSKISPLKPRLNAMALKTLLQHNFYTIFIFYRTIKTIFHRRVKMNSIFAFAITQYLSSGISISFVRWIRRRRWYTKPYHTRRS